LFSVNWPFEKPPEQLFVPVYVPAIVDAVTPLAVPVIVALQFGDPAMDPVGMVIVNVSVVPDRVPDNVPANEMMPPLVMALTGPDTELPAEAKVHVIRPAPVESDTFPLNVPLSVTEGVGAEEEEGEPEPPPQAITTVERALPSSNPTNLPVIRTGILAQPFDVQGF
jgi:hypothetical protein